MEMEMEDKVKAYIISFAAYDGEPLHNGIRADKPPNKRVIISGTVVVQAGTVQPLPGELLEMDREGGVNNQ
jgi:hypothetical protein